MANATKNGQKIVALVATSVTRETQHGTKEQDVVYHEAPDALAKGFLAVHKISKEMNPSDEGKWRITHTSTGFQVRKFALKKDALALRDALVDSEIDWEFVNVKEGLTPELVQRAKEIEEGIKYDDASQGEVEIANEEAELQALEDEGMTHLDAQGVLSAQGLEIEPEFEDDDTPDLEDVGDLLDDADDVEEF